MRRLLLIVLAAVLGLAGCDASMAGGSDAPTTASADPVEASTQGSARGGSPTTDGSAETDEPDVATASTDEPTEQSDAPAATEATEQADRASAKRAALRTAEATQREAAKVRAATAKQDLADTVEQRAEIAANKDVQERLAELGYYDGAIDGVIGSGSTAAVRAFQEANDLAIDGVIGPRTRQALDGDPVTAAQAADDADTEDTDGGGEDADDGGENSDDGDDGDEDDEDDDSATLAMSESEARDRLEELGYWGGSSWSALMAFQKVNDLSADGQFGPETSAALADPDSPDLAGGASTRVEVDLDEQVVHWISGGERVRTMNASSGNGETFHVDGVGGVEALTPIGTFVIERRISGLREGALGGMYDPMYFFHGWALHGSNSVPAHPASHGCVRLSRADASWLFDRAPDGTPVVIHGDRNAFVPGGPDQPPIL